MEFLICCDGINDYVEYWVTGPNYNFHDAMDFAEDVLEKLDGGHADIYDKDDNLIGYVEV